MNTGRKALGITTMRTRFAVRFAGEERAQKISGVSGDLPLPLNQARLRI